MSDERSTLYVNSKVKFKIKLDENFLALLAYVRSYKEAYTSISSSCALSSLFGILPTTRL